MSFEFCNRRLLMIDVIPGILETEFEEIKRRVTKVAPYVEWVQIDLADGVLVDNETFMDPDSFADLAVPPHRELHMMVEDPIDKVDEWVEAGFERLIAQIEGIGDPEAFIDAVQLHSLEVGLALDIDTPVSLIEDYLEILDVVLLMGVQAGYSGQEFNPQVLDKIRKIREIDEMVPIEIDGGINERTGRMCADAGATRLVSTSYIFGAEDMGEAIKRLSEIA